MEDGYVSTHVVGVGSVLFRLEFGGYLDIDGVLFVSELENNFLSVLAMEDDGYAILHLEGRVIVCLVHEGVDATRLLGI